MRERECFQEGANEPLSELLQLEGEGEEEEEEEEESKTINSASSWVKVLKGPPSFSLSVLGWKRSGQQTNKHCWSAKRGGVLELLRIPFSPFPFCLVSFNPLPPPPWPRRKERRRRRSKSDSAIQTSGRA